MKVSHDNSAKTRTPFHREFRGENHCWGGKEKKVERKRKGGPEKRRKEVPTSKNAIKARRATKGRENSHKLPAKG